MATTFWKIPTRALAVIGAILFALPPTPLTADNVPPPPDATTAAPTEMASLPPAKPLPPDQLDSLVAPIALYPDSLLSQTLVACTYPLEVVQAGQWTQQHPELKGQALVDAAKQENWDASVQALVAFPDVIKRLTQDITWTTNLGNAFLADQGSVMDAVQRMRSKAEQAGKLKSTPEANVVQTTDEGQPVVEIQPTNPQVVYVPDYDPAWVWGPPPDYYPYPYWAYPPPPPAGFWCTWHPAVWLSVDFVGCCGGGGWGWAPHWHNHTVIVNNNFITRYNFHTVAVTHVGGQAVWHHDAVHRLGVAYPNRRLATQYHAVPRFHPTVTQAQSQFHASAQRAQTERFGNHMIAANPSAAARNHTAFTGIENGSRARVNSNRGFSSMTRAKVTAGNRGTAGHARAGGAAHGGGHAASHPSGGGSGEGGGHH